MAADAFDRGWATQVLHELERTREFGLISRVVMQNYELIRVRADRVCRGGDAQARILSL